jgi:hypothetical protein
MAFLERFLGKKATPKSQEAVLIYLDGTGLPDEIYAQYDLSTLEDQLIEAINKNHTGEFDGNEIGERETTIYTYGPDAQRLYAVIEPVLRGYPLCQNARIVIRQGGGITRD